MQRLLLFVTVVLSSFIAAGCATMTVGSHAERGFDFSQYRSFDWILAETLPLGDPRLVRDPFFNDHMQGAVEKALARQRIVRLTDGETPDLWIHYHASIRRRIQPLDWASGYDAAFDSAPGVASLEEAIFVLDFIDARTNRLIWRGWVQRRLGNLLENRDRMAATIDDAVSRMLLHLPPAL
jgi:Domain of unknown function (DUF4136)